jgi:hypothetical protein
MSRKLAGDALDLAELSVGLPRRIERPLTQLEHEGLRTASRLQGLEPVVRDLSHIANRLSISILTAALIVGLGLFMQFYIRPFGPPSPDRCASGPA